MVLKHTQLGLKHRGGLRFMRGVLYRMGKASLVDAVYVLQSPDSAQVGTSPGQG